MLLLLWYLLIEILFVAEILSNLEHYMLLKVAHTILFTEHQRHMT